MVKVGDICPLFFDPIKDRFGIECGYTQHFHSDDRILLQVFADEEFSAVLNDLSGGVSEDIVFESYALNDSVTMYYVTFTGLSDGVYSVTVGGMECEPFCVCSSDELLERTCLVRYSHRDNNSCFTNVFWVGDVQQFFEWRVEAGFKSSGFAGKVDNEQYRNQHQKIVELYSVPYDTYTLTVGDASGVPYWFVRHLNRVLSVSHVWIDGVRYVRSDKSVPEMTQVIEDSQMYNATVLLETGVSDSSDLLGSGTGTWGDSLDVYTAIENLKNELSQQITAVENSVTAMQDEIAVKEDTVTVTSLEGVPVGYATVLCSVTEGGTLTLGGEMTGRSLGVLIQNRGTGVISVALGEDMTALDGNTVLAVAAGGFAEVVITRYGGIVTARSAVEE